MAKRWKKAWKEREQRHNRWLVGKWLLPPHDNGLTQSNITSTREASKKMARTRQFEVRGNMAYVKTQMKDGKLPSGEDNMVDIEYSVPATPADFKAYVNSLPEAVMGEDGDWTGELAEVHQNFWSGFDMKLRADKRESSAAESTVIKVDKNSIDLMELPLKKAILAINGVFAVAVATGKEAQKAYEVARRKLLESKKAVPMDPSDAENQAIKVADGVDKEAKANAA